jgi:hypothetical protein
MNCSVLRLPDGNAFTGKASLKRMDFLKGWILKKDGADWSS